MSTAFNPDLRPSEVIRSIACIFQMHSEHSLIMQPKDCMEIYECMLDLIRAVRVIEQIADKQMAHEKRIKAQISAIASIILEELPKAHINKAKDTSSQVIATDKIVPFPHHRTLRHQDPDGLFTPDGGAA